MQNGPVSSNSDNQPKRRLRLPFEKRPSDIGVWSYIHRRGILITLIAYLVFGIVFIAGKISLGAGRAAEGIIIEFPEDAVENPAKRPELDPRLFDDYSNVQNRASNENAELDAGLRDDRGTDASEIYEDAASLRDKMDANRAAWEESLRREQALLESRNAQTQGETQQVQNERVKGRVTVSFSFADPIRNSVKLVVPAYMCEGGGEVVVNATLDNNGHVVAATVDKASSSGDQCMQSTAVSAARSSRFNLDTSAPSRQRGTITYIFIPQ